MIGIVGLGFVGSSVYAAIRDKNDVLFHDPNKIGSTPLSILVEKCEVLFICVPTPSDKNGIVDINIFNDVISKLSNYRGLIVVKSTIPEKYIPDNVVYNPEFLNERTHLEDFKNQNYIVLGGEIDNTYKAEMFYKQYFDLDFNCIKFEHCSIKEASNLKYFNNIYGAYKILFWEFVHDITGDSRKISNMMKNLPDPRMDIVGLDGARGYGGACFPKDIDAFHAEHRHPLTKFMKEFNQSLINT